MHETSPDSATKPTLEMMPSGDGTSWILTWGHGSQLKTFEIESARLGHSILSYDASTHEHTFEEHLVAEGGLPSDEATEVAAYLAEEGFGKSSQHDEHLGRAIWDQLGWADAASVFRATLDTRWVHDYRGDPIAMVKDANDTNVGADVIPPTGIWDLCSGPSIPLPDPASLDASFEWTSQKRRTIRRFRPNTTTLTDVATIARWVLQRQANDPSRFVSHTYINDGPCIGFFIFDRESTQIDLTSLGTQPEDRFVATVYDPHTHVLRLVGASSEVNRWADLMWTQRYGDGSGFALVLAVDIRQYLRKYPIARSYNWSASDTGAFMHTAVMVATGMGLGAFQTPALDDALVCSLLNVDPKEAHPYYMCLFGR